MLTRLSADLKMELQELASNLQQSRPTENIILQSESVESSDSMLSSKNSASRRNKASLIFCHQTSQQQRLLKRYGRQVILCEITNLIERVPFPLFTMFVQTNSDYQLVASFIVEIRNKPSLLQGLNAIKEWNPGWDPKYVVLDYSDEQIEAFKEIFPSKNILHLSFQVETGMILTTTILLNHHRYFTFQNITSFSKSRLKLSKKVNTFYKFILKLIFRLFNFPCLI